MAWDGTSGASSSSAGLDTCLICSGRNASVRGQETHLAFAKPNPNLTLGLLSPRLQAELGFSDSQIGNIGSSFSAGLTAGAFVWGVAVDIVGRQWAFNLTVLCASIFGLCLGAPSSYSAILVLTAFVGFGVGGNIPIDTTITLEFLPQNRRYLLALLSIFQPIGVIICCGIAYGFIPNHSCDTSLKSCKITPPGQACCSRSDNMGWRYLVFTMGAITLAIFFVRFFLFNFQESPKFLLTRGKDAQAVRVLHNVAKFNNRHSSITLEDFTALESDASSVGTDSSEESAAGKKPMLGGGAAQTAASIKEKTMVELSRYKYLFNSFSMARLTILVWITYAFDYWGFTIAGFYLPTILGRKDAALGLGLKEQYRSFVYIYIFGIPGVLLGTVLYRGRWLAMIFSSAMMGVSLFVFSQVNSEASNIGINGMEYFFQSMFNAILYGWTPEAFPAHIRGTAAGLASFWGRLFSIVSPQIAAHLLTKSVNAVLYLAGGGVFVCTVAIALYPRQYIGSQSY